MFTKQEFVRPVYDIKEIPKLRLPEIILCGRSNVGKSTFINTLFNRKDLAKVSSTPGKTRSINYYLIDDKFYLIDLPGYGYAKTSLKERDFWGKLIAKFIMESGHIALAFHLIDSRHDPSELDIQLNTILREHDIPYIVLLNKVDKLRQSEISSAKKNITGFFPELSMNDNLYMYSSVSKLGKREVLKILSDLFIK